MSILAATLVPVNLSLTGDPFAPFDGFTWELGPDPDAPSEADRDWWSEETRDDEPDYDRQADESAALDSYVNGYVFA